MSAAAVSAPSARNSRRSSATTGPTRPSGMRTVAPTAALPGDPGTPSRDTRLRRTMPGPSRPTRTRFGGPPAAPGGHYPAGPSGRGVAVVPREVAVQVLPGRALGDGLHEVLAADERALPRLAAPAERLVLVAARAQLVDADLERLHLLG